MQEKPQEILKNLKKKYSLWWLRISISNHKFSNLHYLFQCDLNKKLTSSLVCKDFESLPCNCINKCKIDGKCIFNKQCRKRVIIYEATCNVCNMNYVGNTQQFMKKRMYGHLNDVVSSVHGKLKSDTFACHMAAHFENIYDNKCFMATPLLPYVSTQVIWQGNVISCNKSFATLRCTLCMQERLDILK